MSKVRMGMVGGGEGAFIGAVHRMAAALDDQIELVCGAFSSDPNRSRESGAALMLPTQRCYADYQTMMASEQQLPESQRMQFVSIVTPNNTHYEIASAALQAGFHVMSDKPATFNLQEAIRLKALVESSGLLYGLTHTYAGYPLVQEARERIETGQLGRVRKVLVEYPQGWLADEVDNKQANWRLDPKQAGVSSSIGDIGVHAAHLAEYVTGLSISEVCADLSTFVPGRELDDDGSMLLRFASGARGVLTASQICIGEENALRLRVYGELAGLEWSQQEPNSLVMKYPDRAMEVLRTGADYLSSVASANTRTPMGHPEGYIEAFANLYLAFADQIREQTPRLPLPGIDAAVRGMAFIELAVQASASQSKWHSFPDV